MGNWQCRILWWCSTPVIYFHYHTRSLLSTPSPFNSPDNEAETITGNPYWNQGCLRYNILTRISKCDKLLPTGRIIGLRKLRKRLRLPIWIDLSGACGSVPLNGTLSVMRKCLRNDRRSCQINGRDFVSVQIFRNADPWKFHLCVCICVSGGLSKNSRASSVLGCGLFRLFPQCGWMSVVRQLHKLSDIWVLWNFRDLLSPTNPSSLFRRQRRGFTNGVWQDCSNRKI